MKNAIASILVIFGVLIALIAAFGGFYNVNETDQVIITQFKKPVGEPITEPGLHFKIPFIQSVNRIEKRALAWDGESVDMPTKDKTYILVDTFGRWRISDPVIYFVRMGDERRALSRIDDILGSETRTAIARHELIEIVRTDKDRKPAQDETLAAVRESAAKVGVLPPIRDGRQKIAQEIKTEAAKKLKEVGIELLDVRLKRVNYKSDVLQQIYRAHDERTAADRRAIPIGRRGRRRAHHRKKGTGPERDRVHGLQDRPADAGRSRCEGLGNLCPRLQPGPGSRGVLSVSEDPRHLPRDRAAGHLDRPDDGQRFFPADEEYGRFEFTVEAGAPTRCCASRPADCRGHTRGVSLRT